MTEGAAGIKLFAFDLDGTLVLGSEAIAGAVALIEWVRERYQVAFFTNGSAQSRAGVHGKLSRIGFHCSPQEVYASSTATGLYLEEEGLDEVFVIGTEALRDELRGLGLRVTQDESATHVVVGFDREIDYGKVSTALGVLRKGGKFIACNEDGAFPVARDRVAPGCGAMVGAVIGACGRRPDFVVGKPNTYVLAKIAGAYRVAPDEIMVVGDSRDSDIAMALSYGSRSILVGTDKPAADASVTTVRDLTDLLRHIREP